MGPILVRIHTFFFLIWPALVKNLLTSFYNLNYFPGDQTAIVQVFWVSEVYCLYFCRDLLQIHWHFRGLGRGHQYAREVGRNNASHQLSTLTLNQVLLKQELLIVFALTIRRTGFSQINTTKILLELRPRNKSSTFYPTLGRKN